MQNDIVHYSEIFNIIAFVSFLRIVNIFANFVKGSILTA